MSYVYPKAAELKDKPLVGSHQCVALVQEYARAPTTPHWRQGEAVLGNAMLKPGTSYQVSGQRQKRKLHSRERQRRCVFRHRIEIKYETTATSLDFMGNNNPRRLSICRRRGLNCIAMPASHLREIYKVGGYTRWVECVHWFSVVFTRGRTDEWSA
jgi:hypothetical protein